MSACRSDFGKTKYMSFLIKDDELLQKYNEIWGGINSDLVYNEKYIKAKI